MPLVTPTPYSPSSPKLLDKQIEGMRQKLLSLSWLQLAFGHALLREKDYDGKILKTPIVPNEGQDYDACTPNQDLTGQCFFYVLQGPQVRGEDERSMQCDFALYFNVNLKRIYSGFRPTVQDLLEEIIKLPLGDMTEGRNVMVSGFEYNELSRVFAPFTSYQRHKHSEGVYLYPNGVFRVNFNMSFPVC